MKKTLSGSAAVYVHRKPFTIISWNVLSEELTEAAYDSVQENGEPLFLPVFRENRIAYIRERLEYFIKKYKHPVFCLQEVNDSPYPSKNISSVLHELFKARYYRVLYQSFGTFNPVYPELGIMTAVPLQHFDVLDIYTRQILPDFPNCFISVTVRPTNSTLSYTIVNTHFPAKFYDEGAMRRVSEALHSLLPQTSRAIVLCGDFNTSTEDSWYPALQNSWKTLVPSSPQSISTVSTQRRDRRVKTNTVFEGRIDHVFYRGRGLNIAFSQELPSSKAWILPNPEIPSDHFPLIMSVS